MKSPTILSWTALLTLFLSLEAGFSPVLAKVSEKNDKIQVMLLGVYHFNNRGLDDHNLKIESSLTKKRQAEIEEVLQHLMRFSPEKIFIEIAPKVQTKYDSLYSLFKLNKLKLDTLKNGQDEVFQIGFKLAKKLRHSRVFCVNALNIWFSEYVNEVADRLKMDIMKKDEEETVAWLTKTQAFINSHTIMENLAYFNLQSAIAYSHNYYNSILPLVLDDSQLEQFQVISKKEKGVSNNCLALEERYIGAELTAEWYRRNIKIYANMLHFIEPEDQRVLAIYGQGHVRILQHLFQDNPKFQVISPIDYLN